MFNKIKQLILQKSDSYNFYKNQYTILNNELENKIDELETSNKKLQEDVKKLTNKNIELSDQLKENTKKNSQILDSYNNSFNTIFLDYNLEPKGALKNTHLLCIELLNLIVNICKKYNLSYWLDYGNLLGAVRHDGFIPWDDDMDVGMMRKDFNKLLEVLPNEIKINNLENYLDIQIDEKLSENSIFTFLQIRCLKGKKFYGGIDIFAYDFLVSPFDGIDEKFNSERKSFLLKLLKGTPRSIAIDEYYDSFNLSYDKQDYMIPGIDGVRSKWNTYDFVVMDINMIFPLKTITFCGVEYNCPRNPDYYLKCIYGEYYDIPKIIDRHKRIRGIRRISDVDGAYKPYFDKLREVNNNY